MKLLADENFPRQAVDALRTAGHDVLWARTDMPAAPDTNILDRARAEARVIVTFDKDFGTLAFHAGLPAECGVILFRCGMDSPETAANRVLSALNAEIEWPDHFAVVEDERIRVRPLPR